MSNLPKIGIDIGGAAVKVVELAPSGRNKWKLLSAASIPMTVGGIVDSVSNQATVAGAIAKLLKDAGVRSRKVIGGLPEEQISSHVVEMPLLKDDEIEQALQWQVEQYIPIPAEQAVWSYQVIKRDQTAGGMEILLAAAAKNLVEAYRKTLDMAGLDVLALETELMATARSLVAPGAPLSLVIDIGARSTDMGIIAAGQLVFARTIPTAGEAFTRAIESALGLETTVAEQYKNTYGFSGAYMDGKLATAMKPVLTIISSEAKKTVDFYMSKHAGEMVKSVILSGGVAALPDVVAQMSAILGMEVAVGNPFARVEMDEKQKQMLGGNAPFYAVAVGLAMREV